MTDTRDLGRAFLHPISLRSESPLVHIATTHEVDHPYRISKSLVLRLWRSKGLVLGWWRKTGRSEEVALLEALQGHETALLDDDGYLLPGFEDV